MVIAIHTNTKATPWNHNKINTIFERLKCDHFETFVRS